jgi:hypothetical protein
MTVGGSGRSSQREWLDHVTTEPDFLQSSSLAVKQLLIGSQFSRCHLGVRVRPVVVSGPNRVLSGTRARAQAFSTARCRVEQILSAGTE